MQQKVLRTEIDKINQIVMKHFGVSNLSKVYDKHEGTAFLNKAVLYLSSAIVFQKETKKNVINFDTYSIEKTISTPKFRNEFGTFEIIGFHKNHPPIIDTRYFPYHIIFVEMLKECNAGKVIGFINSEDLNDDLFGKPSSSVTRHLKPFIGFDKVSSISKIIS